MTANEVARLTGTSVRTLHHYDSIGLLCPVRSPQNDYREYTEEDLDTLQQILFFKACGFALAEIQNILSSPSFNRLQAFELQRASLVHQQQKLNTMLTTLDKTIRTLKGEDTMTPQEKFGGFDMNNNPYEEEARRLWGNEAVDSSNKHIAALPQKEKDAIAKGMDDLFIYLATLRNKEPASEEVQAGMERMFSHFNGNFGYQYSLEAFAGLGEMYITDERFTKNIDKYGEGLSAFLAKAMKLYATNHKG
ncbi:MAG: MerR family transcriptional regulator [Oscillospiraceae bacterium]